jgi:nucleoid-associated protein YgaU
MKILARRLTLAMLLVAIGVAALGCASSSKYEQLTARHQNLTERLAAADKQIATIERQNDESRKIAASVPTPEYVDQIPSAPSIEAGGPSTSGNTATAAPVTTGGKRIEHRVQNSDTLWKLAVRYYGDGQMWKKIRDANPGKIDAKGNINVGQMIVIPPK